MKKHLALIAFFLGFAGVCMAAFQNNFIHDHPAPSGPTENRSLKEVAADAARKLLEDKVLHPKPAQSPASRQDPRDLPLHPYQMVYTALGVLAIGLGFFAWAMRDHVRLSGGAVALGFVAVAWQWVLIAVCVAVVILIVANFSA